MGPSGMIKITFPHVHSYTKGGKRYHYFRKGRVRIRLPGQPGSAEFMAAYEAAKLSKPPAIGESRTVAGTMNALAAQWYQTPEFLRLAPASKKNYKRHVEGFLAKHGKHPVALAEPHHLREIIARFQHIPSQANALRNVLRQLFQYAFDMGMRRDNPMRDIRKLRYQKRPYATWGEGEIAQFLDHWAPGTRARLALMLLLYTGQRRGDVIRLGPQHIRAGCVTVTQQKTGKPMALPIHAELRAELDTLPMDHLAFLVTEQGRPFASGNAFYNWFTWCCAKAGLPKGLSPHGLRKATARRLAEAGCSPHEIASITGHASLQEVERYTKEASQNRLARAAVTRLGTPKKEHP